MSREVLLLCCWQHTKSQLESAEIKIKIKQSIEENTNVFFQAADFKIFPPNSKQEIKIWVPNISNCRLDCLFCCVLLVMF